MKPKFTKGPWFVRKKEVLNSIGYRIAICSNEPNLIGVPELGEINAHLIAAAPEMYAELERSLENPLFTDVLQKTRIAKLLKKAQGEL